jgi:structural maintenance of chromosome 3 (chondroitin sulfate proteoglycan 6)
MSAYVEIIFDNTDKRFSEPGDEVVIRRTIGPKKDEYSVDRKVQTRADVLKILETAGFAKENPFYIVPQGRIAAITNMKESERLNLLKEIAGTNTYDDRRIQSLKIMAETNSKREKIDETLAYIEERLKELEEEKDELRDFQDKDRERRCLEYAHWHRLQASNNEALEQLEEQRQDGAGASTKDRAELQKVEKEMGALEHKSHELKQNLELLAIERRQLDEDRKDAARLRAKAELKAKHLDETRHAREQVQRRQEAELQEVTQKIQAAEADLAKITPEYEKARHEEATIKQQRDEALAGKNRLLTKQTRSSQFKTKAERDKYLQQEIEDATTSLGVQKANAMDAEEQVKAVQASIAQLEKSIHDIRQKIEGYGGERATLAEKLTKAQEAREQLHEERKRLRREEDKLSSLLSNTRAERDQAESILSHAMDSATAKGLATIRRLKRERDIPGAYGTLAELMHVPLDAYKLPVEQVAGNSLFHYVVDNAQTATMLSDHLYKTYGGRLTFMPLEQLRPRQVKMPRASDAQPLISKIEFDPKYEKAFQQVFGRTIVCPNLTIASQYARSHGLDAITPEGDTTNKRGAMTGGYVDARKSRLDAVRRVTELRDLYEQQLADLDKIRKEIEVVDQKVTAASGEEHKLEQQMRQFEMGFEPLKMELRTKNAQLERERGNLETALQRQAQVERNLKDLDDSITAYQAELAQDFKKALTASEERQLEEFTAEVHRLQRELKEVSKRRFDLEGRKKMLETELQSHLRPQQDQLRSLAFENATAGGSDSYKDAQRELKKAQRIMDDVEQQLRENEQKTEKASAELAQVEARLAEKETQAQELQRRIEQHQKRMEKNVQTRARLISQAAEYAKNIRDLGILPEGFDKYEKLKPEQVRQPNGIPCF